MGTGSRWRTLPLATIALVTAVLITSACTAGPSNRPAMVVNDGPLAPQAPPSPTPSATPLPPLDPPGRSMINWTDCDDSMKARLTTAAQALGPQCARVPSVLDSPSLPGRGPLRINVLKVGTGTVPLVVVNDIDGQSGAVRAAELATSLPADLLKTFYLVGVDRRGSGGSEAVRCVPDDIRTEMISIDPAAPDMEDLLDSVRKAGQQCVVTLENRLYAMDTWRTSADLDRIREVLGVQHLNAIGFGEGSRVLGVYADRYPERVGRMVYDGLPDPSDDTLVTMEGEATGAEAAFGEFAKDCVARKCSLGTDPKQAFLDLLNQLRTTPLTTTDSSRLTAGVAARAVLIGLSDRRNWPMLADHIALAKSGQGDQLFSWVKPMLLDTRDQPASLDIALVTECNDTKTRLALERLNATAKDWRTRYPLFGGVMAEGLVLCSAWSVAARPPLSLSGRGLPPLVVITTAADPVTPEAGTQRAAQQLPSAVMISWQGAGHGSIQNSSCVADTAKTFLVDGKVPAAGTACPP
ncbi:alpha/beta hydrolase [Actinocrispum wychmicini]|uniref:TAP-like protein n=1 Tax=Actinocrispum wychmicini TaxID=1213861 RepID=A0A4V2S5J5_9PSEU|nr:alpha/beta hydrolase [Actinocrispum wychmicini]TCO52440.1 TAP-like protein [Actinocrispum wychmicini]